MLPAPLHPRHGVQDELIGRNPCGLKGASAGHHDERPGLNVEQVVALVEAVEPRYSAMLLMATWCSLRFGELAALTRAVIDLTNRRVRVA